MTPNPEIRLGENITKVVFVNNKSGIAEQKQARYLAGFKSQL
ncbi:MAG: hypothetical protein AAF662_10075 [Pseudomonadota bacterium]